MEARRPDVVLLANGAVVVLEYKSKAVPTQADIDQASAYARDLRCYHRSCHDRAVIPIVVPFGMKGYQGQENQVHIAGPDVIDQLIVQLEGKTPADLLSQRNFSPKMPIVPCLPSCRRHGSCFTTVRCGPFIEPGQPQIRL